MAQRAHSILLRRVQVENYNVIFELRGRRPSLLAIRKNVHCVVLAFEALANRPGKHFIIFRNKNSHNLSRPWSNQASLVRNRSTTAKTKAIERSVDAGMAFRFKKGRSE